MIRPTALEFIDSLERQRTADGVLKAMQAALSPVGIDLFCLNVLADPGQEFEEVLLASRLPVAWLDLYIAENYVAHDPSQRHAKRTVHPYEWKDAPYDPEHETGFAEVVRRANDFDVGNGFVVPVPGPQGCIGQVWMSAHNFRLSKRDKPSLHLIALYAFDRVRRLSRRVRQKPPLSARQREILTWTAAGKTAWEIGEILAISQRTVEWHLRSIAQKLGTFNRMQTVAVALREQLIAL